MPGNGSAGVERATPVVAARLMTGWIPEVASAGPAASIALVAGTVVLVLVLGMNAAVTALERAWLGWAPRAASRLW